MATQYMLTTTDNPFDPFTRFDEWFRFDAHLGYHTPSYLARIAKSSYELSDADQDLALEQAMDEIIEIHGKNGPYTKVSREDITSN